MTPSTDARTQYRRVLDELTAPGGAFELATEDVLGAPTLVFARRAHSLSQLLASSVRHGDHPYLVTRRTRLSHAQHAARVASLARVLRDDYRVRPGDRVGIAAANSPSWIISFWAIVSLGAVAVGYNAWWSPREFEHAIGHSRPTVTVADSKRAALLSGVDTPLIGLEEDLPGMTTAHLDEPLPAPDIDEDDPAVILYTSGTSGRPKGALHTHRNLIAACDFHRLNDAGLAALGDTVGPEARVHLLTMPLFHIASLHNLALPGLVSGSTVVLLTGGFDVEEALCLIEQERVTNWGIVPTMASRLLAHGDLRRHDTSSLTAFSIGSAPSSTHFQQRLRTELPFATALVNSYGLTESCTALTVATPLDMREAPGTVGPPVPGVELEIRDPLGRAVGPGVTGEICARSAYNMRGYWDDPAATTAAFHPDRWLRTGDLGEIDPQGRLRLASRRSDLIIRGGENVYPAEVEAVLSEHPDVAECLVLGVPHHELGQEVAVIVVPRGPAADLTELEAQLRRLARQSLAYYKVPTRWRFAPDPLPRNATGKVVRARISW